MKTFVDYFESTSMERLNDCINEKAIGEQLEIRSVTLCKSLSNNYFEAMIVYERTN